MVNLSFEYRTNLAAFIMRWWGGDHLNYAICQGGSDKFYSYSRGITKNLQNLKNFQSPPLPVKNDTSLKAISEKLTFKLSVVYNWKLEDLRKNANFIGDVRKF